MNKQIALVSYLLIITGCTSVEERPIPEEIIIGKVVDIVDSSLVYKHQSPRSNLIRTGRYTRISQKPLPEQQDLLSVNISTKIPSSLKTVKQAIEFLLLRSGYSLLDLSEQSIPTKIMMSNTLPETHREIQIMSLRSALSMLAGSAFELRENNVYRTIMYVKK